MGAQRLMPIVLVLWVAVAGCSASPVDRPRDGARAGREAEAPADATREGNVTNVSIRFIDDAEVAATATAQAQITPSPPTLIPAPGLASSTPLPVVAAASPGSLVGSTPGWRIARTDRQGVRLHATPSSGGAVVTSVAEGTLVDPIEGPVVAEGVRWIQVQAPGGRRGWVSDTYLEPPPIPTLAPAPSPGGVYVIDRTDGAGANVREGPSTAAAVLGNLREGSVVERLEGPVSADGRAWQRVRGDGLEGWVLAVVVQPR
jgi:SH3-like domain-containing protein